MKKMFGAYAVFLILFTAFTYFFVDLNLVYLKTLTTGVFQTHRLEVTIIYILSLLIFYLFYYLFLRKIDKDALRKLIITSGVILFFAYPAVLSYDIFNYVFTAKVTYFYHENPYIVMPIEFHGDPLLLFTHAPNKTALYGPFWILVTAVPYLLGVGNFLLTLFNFKLIVSLFYVGLVWLIYKISGKIKNTAFFALNPLVLVESFVSGHNDVVMMFFALLSLFILKNKKILGSGLSLLGSILIKYATFFLLPVYIYCLWLKIKRKEINWDRIWLASFLLMLMIFFLSPLREEIYPWYAIWPLTFLSLISDKYKSISLVFSVFTFFLMLRYVPFMYLGTYFGSTPAIKIFLTFVPAGILSILLLYKQKLAR